MKLAPSSRVKLLVGLLCVTNFPARPAAQEPTSRSFAFVVVILPVPHAAVVTVPSLAEFVPSVVDDKPEYSTIFAIAPP